MYKRFLFLMEACYSGSMFVNLDKSLNVYALTAADPDHSSYESPCPPNDVVIKKALGTCLSCYWDNAMEWFIEGGTEHTLDELHDHIHKKVAESSSQNASKWGDLELGKLPLSTFMGNIPANRLNARKADDSEKIAKADVPAHLAKWNAIRASGKDKETAMKAYETILMAEAKKEVEVIRKIFILDQDSFIRCGVDCISSVRTSWCLDCTSCTCLFFETTFRRSKRSTVR